MATARPLREVFAELAGDEAARHADPAQLLRDSGHPDLPDVLVSAAVISFADTAPVEVAEHLAPYVAASSVVPTTQVDAETDIPLSGWVEALATAPDVADLDTRDPADGLDEAPEFSVADAQPPMPDEPAPHGDVDFGLGFGGGGGTADPLDALDETSYPDATVSDVSDIAAEVAPLADDPGNDAVWDDNVDDEPVDDAEGPDPT
ncbi:MAG TPA: hypothetical protein VF462_16020 [Micromonosporaceae bacterium]